MSFLLDTNILIEAKERTPFDVFPTFWEKLREEIIAGHIFTSVKVQDEIHRGNEDDILVSWVDSLPESFFINIDASVLTQYQQVINYATSNPVYNQAALSEFSSANIADAFLIATALAKQMLLVTNETSEPQRRSKVKIPDVATPLNVTCCSIVDMLRRLSISI